MDIDLFFKLDSSTATATNSKGLPEKKLFIQNNNQWHLNTSALSSTTCKLSAFLGCIRKSIARRSGELESVCLHSVCDYISGYLLYLRKRTMTDWLNHLQWIHKGSTENKYNSHSLCFYDGTHHSNNRVIWWKAMQLMYFPSSFAYSAL